MWMAMSVVRVSAAAYSFSRKPSIGASGYSPAQSVLVHRSPVRTAAGVRWAKAIWAGEYPDAPMDGFLKKLYAAAETSDTDIAVHIDPRDTRETLDTLENRIEDLQADYEYLTEKHRASARGVEKDQIGRAHV